MGIKQQNSSLSDEQKDVLFYKATEAPFSGAFLKNKKIGNYTCANCGAVLFDSEKKFDSSSGWPSFYDVKTKQAIKLSEDNSYEQQRVEVACNTCGAHLGHVFNDADDTPTGMRFCINSLSLDFIERQKD